MYYVTLVCTMYVLYVVEFNTIPPLRVIHMWSWEMFSLFHQPFIEMVMDSNTRLGNTDLTSSGNNRR